MPKTTEFSLLFEVSQTLDSSLDLREVLGPVLKIIARHKGILRGSLTLLNRDTGEISIEAAYGLSPSQQRKGRYRIGEGVIGQVFQTGRPAVIPRVSEEPRFLNRTGAIAKAEGSDISYLSVPIKLENRVVGALSIDVPYQEETSLQDEVRLLSIVGSLISQAVKLRQKAQEERRQLIEENLRLHEELKDRFRPSNLIGNSGAMQAVYDLIAQVSGSDATVLIQGESGTGKELVAHAIHSQQPPGRKAVHQGELRRASGDGHRKRAVRAREGGLHGGYFGPQGAIRAGRRRHPVPGRSGRSFRGPADQAPARAAGARVRAGGRRQHPESRRAAYRGHQRRAGEIDPERALPPGPVLPVERVPDPHPAAAGAQDRHPQLADFFVEKYGGLTASRCGAFHPAMTC
jgi:hypothetical protein